MACLMQEANKKHSVNGFIFCNMPEASVPQDSHVRFVLIGVGDEVGMHTPSFTGHLQNTAEQAAYVVELFPGAARISNLLAGQIPAYCTVLVPACMLDDTTQLQWRSASDRWLAAHVMPWTSRGLDQPYAMQQGGSFA